MAKLRQCALIGDATDGAPDIIIGADTIEYVHNFCYLGCTINDEYDDTVELRKRLAMARGACQSLITIWKDRSINRTFKASFVKKSCFSDSDIWRRNVGINISR